MARRRFLILSAVGAISILALSHSSVGQTQERRVIDIKIEKRKVVVPKRVIRITERETVDLRWSSDEMVKLHLHGYDRELKVTPGKPATMTLTGRATGRFPITSHGWGHSGHGHHALTYLEVHPR